MVPFWTYSEASYKTDQETNSWMLILIGDKLRGRPKTTLKIVINKEICGISEGELIANAKNDLDHLRSLAADRKHSGGDYQRTSERQPRRPSWSTGM